MQVGKCRQQLWESIDGFDGKQLILGVRNALPASDRPYKKAKTLSESIKILWLFKKDRHIDAELFDLFLRSGVYRRYAERFLKPEQIDEVDIAPYLGPIPERT